MVSRDTFDPERTIAFVTKAQPLHLPQRPAIVRLDFGSQSFRLGRMPP